MTFLYPLGLLGLLGIPVLILIYIIKSKYTEQTIASTYLWELSERFLKRKKRVSRLTGIISLILQLLAVTIISLAIAHPIITVPDSANAYCFILDASGSMHMDSSKAGQTRFEAGKEEIADRIQGSMDGSSYTLICVGDATTVIYQDLQDKEQAVMLLSELKPAYSTASMGNALSAAQDYFQKNPATKTYLVTDTAYESVNNLEMIFVGQAVENYGVSGVNYTFRNRLLKVTGLVTSYESDATLTVGLFLDGKDTPEQTQTLAVSKGQSEAFALDATIDGYASITVKVLEEDGLALDNQYVIHNIKSENSYNTLIVSERPFFLESILNSQLNANITVLSPEQYEGQTGYGLYIFDSVEVGDNFQMPTDGTVWLMNVNGSVEGAGFTVQGDVSLKRGELLEMSQSTSTAAKALLTGLKDNEIHVTRYIKCSFYRNFTTLYSYKGYPVVFAGANENGTREVVFAFDLHQSDLPMLYDFSVLMRNLLNYSFPDMVDKTNFECGEVATVNMIANCDSVRVETPRGDVTYLNTEAATDEIHLAEVGKYTITMTVAGTAREFYIWSSLNEQERAPTQTGAELSIQGDPSSEGMDGKYDPLTVMFIVLAVIFLADWMVYCYEKYQLR